MAIVFAAILVMVVGVLDLWAALLPAPVLVGTAAAVAGALAFWWAAGDRGPA